jgi:Ca2+-binding RTX toxin-like protein
MPNTVEGTNASEIIDAADGVTTKSDIIYGHGGSDQIYGLDGDDQIYGGEGADTIYGGAGVDAAIYLDSLVGVQVSLKQGAGFGGTAQGDKLFGIEDLGGSIYNDVLEGDGSNNWIFGEEGNDILKGGGGADHLDGGFGKDTASYVGSDAAVLVNLDVGGFGGHAQGDTYTNVENITGSTFGDILVGSSASNVLLGLSGNDQISGYDGDDLIEGGVGSDILNGGGGTDTLSYTSSMAGVVVNLGNGMVQGGDAQGDSVSYFENVSGSEYADSLFGNGLANLLKGGKGADSIFGGINNDVIEGGLGGDTLDGGSDNDTLSYAGSAAGVVINLGNGMASGGDADGDMFKNFENVTGSAKADSLFGDGLANRIEGGAGHDFLFGGLNSDVFVFNLHYPPLVHQVDAILDFAPGTDKIEFDGGLVSDFTGLQDHMFQKDGYVMIQVGDDHFIQLQNVTLTDLTANDFLFV